MLISNPETASIVVVADDPDLTCRIIEPFDQPDAVVTATVLRVRDRSLAGDQSQTSCVRIFGR